LVTNWLPEVVVVALGERNATVRQYPTLDPTPVVPFGRTGVLEVCRFGGEYDVK